MIVNSNYVEKPQWSDILSPGVAYYFTITGPSPCKILHALTALQFWIQFVSLILMANSCVLRRYGLGDAKRFNAYGFSRFDEFYYDISLTFQICDIVLAAYASYHLRNAKILFNNNADDVEVWLTLNNLYVPSSIACLYFAFPAPRVSALAVKTISVCVFESGKVWVVRRIRADEMSSYITLEQRGPSPLDDPPTPPSGAGGTSPEPTSHVVTIETVDDADVVGPITASGHR